MILAQAFVNKEAIFLNMTSSGDKKFPPDEYGFFTI